MSCAAASPARRGTGVASARSAPHALAKYAQPPLPSSAGLLLAAAAAAAAAAGRTRSVTSPRW